MESGTEPGDLSVNMATVHHHAGNPEAAISALHQALPLIDPEREPRLLLCARHNLIFYIAALGRFLEAQRLYIEARPLYRSFNEPWVQNRRKWVRAKIAKGLGQLRRAETQFLAARDGFLGREFRTIRPWFLWSWRCSTPSRGGPRT